MSGSRVSKRQFLCIRVTPGRRAQSKAFEGCVRESRSARSGTPSVCAGGTGRAVRECACTRCACPSVLKDTSERRRQSWCRVTSPRAPVIIARCRSRARIRAEAAAAAASAGTVAPGLGKESGSQTPAVPTSRTLASHPALRNLTGFLGTVPALSSTRGRSVRVLRAPRRRRRRERATAQAVLRSGGGSREAAGGGGSRPGRVTALAARTGASRQAASQVTQSFSPRAASRRPEA